MEKVEKMDQVQNITENKINDDLKITWESLSQI